jgi:serine/threonine protein kinase
MSFVFVIQTAEFEAREIDLDQVAMPFVAGRDSDLSQVVLQDSQCSRAHCKFTEMAGGLLVEDLDSRNGTWLNGIRIQQGVLKPRDILRLGSSEITIEEAAPPDPLVGRKLGGFELTSAMGHGSYGTVYSALQVNLGRSVAVKILSEECSRDPEQVEQFLTEARRAGRLNHPNLVQVHDVLQVEGRHLLVMELMSSTAIDLLRGDGPMAEAQALQVLRDMTKALGYAESQRLVHRDVKPDNILVNEEGVFKLADLGIAASLSANGVATQDKIFGSPHYVAPEQARGGAIDGRADLYALGASVWHLVTGQTLFQGNSRQLVAHHCTTPIPDLRRLAPKLSPSLVTLINGLLEKSPDRRPAHAHEANKRVEHILATLTARVSTPRPLVRRVRRIRRFR